MQTVTGRTTAKTGARQIISTETIFIGRVIEDLTPIPHGPTSPQGEDISARQEMHGTLKLIEQMVSSVVRHFPIKIGGGLVMIPAITFII